MEFGDDELKKFLEEMKRMDAEREKETHRFMLEAGKKMETDLKLLMYEIGDFDPRHYEMQTMDDVVEEGDGKFRMDLYVKHKYVATPRQKRKALKILKNMYGKKFKEMALALHPKIQMLMGDEEFGNMINDDDIVREFKCRRL